MLTVGYMLSAVACQQKCFLDCCIFMMQLGGLVVGCGIGWVRMVVLNRRLLE